MYDRMSMFSTLFYISLFIDARTGVAHAVIIIVQLRGPQMSNARPLIVHAFS